VREIEDGPEIVRARLGENDIRKPGQIVPTGAVSMTKADDVRWLKIAWAFDNASLERSYIFERGSVLESVWVRCVVIHDDDYQQDASGYNRRKAVVEEADRIAYDKFVAGRDCRRIIVDGKRLFLFTKGRPAQVSKSC
jgi:hypothetical protein